METESGSEAFRWTAETGMAGIGDLPGGFNASSANDVSTDGRVIVGRASSELSQGSSEAFRWTAVMGMQGLGFLSPNDFASTAEFTSSDGRLVFGFSLSTPNFINTIARTYVWDPQHGMRDFTSVLVDEHGLGPALAGWSGLVPQDISDDGLSIVGYGANPDGNRQGWLVRLDRPIGVPEPAAWALLLACLLSVPMVRDVRRRMAEQA